MYVFIYYGFDVKVNNDIWSGLRGLCHTPQHGYDMVSQHTCDCMVTKHLMFQTWSLVHGRICNSCTWFGNASCHYINVVYSMHLANNQCHGGNFPLTFYTWRWGNSPIACWSWCRKMERRDTVKKIDWSNYLHFTCVCVLYIWLCPELGTYHILSWGWVEGGGGLGGGDSSL